MHPCSTPTAPAVIDAPWRPVARPSPPGSTPTRRTRRSPMNRWKSPIAFEPPPTQATSTSGRRPRAARAWRRVSRPITAWKSRTIIGYGCGPRAEEPHAEDVQRLALDVLGAHVHLALEPEQRRGRRGRHAVLARAGLGDHAGLPHAFGEERLAEHVVDLVGAGVAKVLALEPDAGAAAVLAEPRGEVERRRPARVVGEGRGQARLEPPGAPGAGGGALELDERRHERLGHEAPAEAAEVALGVRERGGPRHLTPFAAATNRRTLSGSLRPGAASPPPVASPPYGPAAATPRATLS